MNPTGLTITRALSRSRRATDVAARAACALATVLALVPLFSVLIYIGVRGVGGLSWDFFTQGPAPVGDAGGGMAHALLGSLLMVGLASALALPVGVLVGVYLSEMGHGRLARLVRLAADVMSGVPSIVVGIFIYTAVVLSMRQFSALAGALALAVLMLPTVARTSEEVLRLVPDSLREAALALGAPRWRVTLMVVVRTAAPGIATGGMLAVARAAGETAPLLFTALSSRFLSLAWDQPMASLPVQIYTYAVSPYAEWHQQAWSAALVLLSLVLVLNVVARGLASRRSAPC